MIVPRSSCILAAALALSSTRALAQPALPSPVDVTFTAVDEAGKPVPGVTAYITRSFTSLPPYTPSQDHGLTFHSGDDGVIHAGTLAPGRGFTLAVAAPGYAAKTVAIVPGRPPSNVPLQRRDPAHQDNAIRGRLMSASGQPVAHAMLLVTRSQRTKNSWLNGADTGDDAMAITDDEGRFALVPDEKSLGTWLEVHKDGVALQEFPDLLPGPSEQTLVIPQPVTIRGRLTQGPTPAAGIQLALSAGETSQQNPPIALATTDDKGQFSFPLVPPNHKWLLFATMNPARPTTIESREVEPAPAGEIVNLGDLSLVPTIDLGGFVKAEGAATPPDSRVILQRFRTAEVIHTAAGKDGTFAFPHIPRGSYTIYVDTQDQSWRLSPKNRAYPFDNAYFIQGALNQDKPDLAILITQDKSPPIQRRAETLPIRGIEPHEDR